MIIILSIRAVLKSIVAVFSIYYIHSRDGQFTLIHLCHISYLALGTSRISADGFIAQHGMSLVEGFLKSIYGLLQSPCKAKDTFPLFSVDYA